MPAVATTERLRLSRALLIVVAGSALGLGWNAFSGHGFALGSNVYVKPGDELIEAPAARQRLEKGALMLDARMLFAYEAEHIPGALPLPEDDFEKHFALLEPKLRSSLDVIVYCAGFGCEAAHIVTRKLKQRGVPAVILNEGWPAWTDAGYPTKTGPQP